VLYHQIWTSLGVSWTTVNRRQMVKINGITGDKMIINCGDPQGIVLGPILFILYIDSICSWKGLSSHMPMTHVSSSQEPTEMR